jgi:capsular exopolysaccharide synthesis family protein
MNTLEIKRPPVLNYAAAEAINTLCTNLTFSGADVKRIMVTSFMMGEGKSFTSLNVATTLAKFGKKVALVDADLRRSSLESRYGIRMPNGKIGRGISHYLAGLTSLNDIVYGTDIPNLLIVPVGREVSNSLALLNTEKFSELMDILGEQADYVIVDAPPVGVVIDAAEIAKSCDGTLFVVSYNKVRRRELMDAKRQIERTGSKILGAVLNNVTFDTLSSKRYYYKSYYSKYGYSYYSGRRDQDEHTDEDSPRRR